MPFKTLFLPMAFEEVAVSLTDAALDMAATFKAHVLAHHVRQRHSTYPPVDFFPTSGSTTTIIQEGHDEATAAFARTLRAAFEERCDKRGAHIVPLSEALKQNGITVSWSESTGHLAADYSLAARVSDLVVLAIPDQKQGSLEHEIFNALLMQSGAPVLALPRDGFSGLVKRPLVAWDGSLQASRVIRSAFPLLIESEETTLLTIGETDAGTPGLEAAKLWLERGGVRVKCKTVDWPKGPIAERILNQCEASNSDVVVMGGYSHSPLRESMVGGVTRHILHHSDKPLFMVH